MPDIVHRIGIRAPLAQVYAAVSSADGVAGWWSRETRAIEGRSLESRFQAPDGAELGRMAFDLVRTVPDESVHWRFTEGPDEWVGTDATFEFSRDGDMTLVIFGHRGWREPVEFMAHCSMKWAVFLLSLRQYAETGTGRPAPGDVKIDNWN
jgi:uncharacterized protein YndB with AHSA1/START domain